MARPQVNVSRWLDAFARIEAAVTRGGPWPSLRLCANVWYVSGILYEGHNAAILADTTYDALSKRLLDNLDAAHRDGAGLLQADELEAGTAMRWRSYLPPFHAVAAVLAAKGVGKSTPTSGSSGTDRDSHTQGKSKRSRPHESASEKSYKRPRRNRQARPSE